MALYRCASCGSPNVITDKQSAGISYDYKKGIVGTAILGVGGAVAGIQNGTQTVYKCQDCGVALTYPMPQDIKIAIDLGVMSEEARHQIKIGGVPVFWDVLKKKFKNIEEGQADRNIRERNQNRSELLLSYGTATQEEFDNAVDTLAKYRYRSMEPSEYHAWQNSIRIYIENLPRFLSFPLPEKYRDFYMFSLCDEFLAYLHQQIRAEINPDFTLFDENGNGDKELTAYAASNPFVLAFADQYFINEKHVYIHPFTKKIVEPWSAEEFGQKIIQRGRLNSPSRHFDHIWLNYKLEANKLHMSYIAPEQIEVGEKLYCRQSYKNGEEFMEDYFSQYPEKRTEFNEKIAAHQKQISSKPQLQQNLEQLKSRMARSQSKISTAEAEIQRLKGKFFGKKKALAQAEELEKNNQTLREEINKTQAGIESLNKQIAAILDDQAFYHKLVKEMDYFIVWRLVGDAKS